jgi:hypothetical protein
MKTVPLNIILCSLFIMSACALDVDDDQSIQQESDEQPETSKLEDARIWWSGGETEHLKPIAVPPGWETIDIAGAPAGAVIVARSVEANATLAPLACPAGFACLYQNTNRGPFRVAVQSGIGIGNLKGVRCSTCTNGTHGNDGTFNDQMSSWENRSGRRYCWWFHAGPSGEVHTMSNGLIVNVLSRENDQASAFGPC